MQVIDYGRTPRPAPYWLGYLGEACFVAAPFVYLGVIASRGAIAPDGSDMGSHLIVCSVAYVGAVALALILRRGKYKRRIVVYSALFSLWLAIDVRAISIRRARTERIERMLHPTSTPSTTAGF